MVKAERLNVPNSSGMSLPYSCCARTENIDTTTAKMTKVLKSGDTADDMAITMRWSFLMREKIRIILKLCMQTDTQRQRHRAGKQTGRRASMEIPCMQHQFIDRQKQAGKQTGAGRHQWDARS